MRGIDECDGGGCYTFPSDVTFSTLNFGRLGRQASCCFVGTSGVDGGTCYINMCVFSGTCGAKNYTCAAAEALV